MFCKQCSGYVTWTMYMVYVPLSIPHTDNFSSANTTKSQDKNGSTLLNKHYTGELAKEIVPDPKRSVWNLLPFLLALEPRVSLQGRRRQSMAGATLPFPSGCAESWQSDLSTRRLIDCMPVRAVTPCRYQVL